MLLVTTRDEFVTKFNDFMAERAGGETYSSILASAGDAGYVNEPSTLSALILAIPIGYYIYIGFTYSSYIGGEVKEPGRNQPRIILATLAFAAAMYLVCLWRFYEIVGQDFVNSVVYLNNNTDDGSGLPVDPVLNLFAGIMTGSTILNVIMALSFFLWNFLLLFVIATVITRNLFAWSVDRILPDAVTKVDRRFHSPWVATLIVIVASEILLVLYVFTTFFQEVSNYIVLYSIAFWATSFAAILLPYRRPEIYQSAPEFVAARSAGCRCWSCSASATSCSSRWSSTRPSSCPRSAARRVPTRCCSSPASTSRAWCSTWPPGRSRSGAGSTSISPTGRSHRTDDADLLRQRRARFEPLLQEVPQRRQVLRQRRDRARRRHHRQGDRAVRRAGRRRGPRHVPRQAPGPDERGGGPVGRAARRRHGLLPASLQRRTRRRS